jgi:outer membrane protein TolC
MQRRSNNGLFDESQRMAQSARAMKRIGILLAALLCAFGASAQTANGGNTAGLTESPDQIYATLTNGLAAESSSPKETRELSLQECIDLTLKNNIELQYNRYSPQIARYNLKAAYSAYDPTALFSGQHSHSESGATFLGTNIIGGTLSDRDSFNTTLTGLTPWGLQYQLFGNTADTVQNNGFTLRRNANAQAGVTLTQPLLRNFWIDSSRLLIRLDKSRLKSSEYGLKLQLMQTLTQLEQAYYDLIYAREFVKVQQKAAEFSGRTVLENRKKLEVGAAAELELAQAEAQAAQDQAAIISAQSTVGTQERVLKLYITDQIAKWADIGILPTGTLTAPKRDFNRQNSWRKALESRPDYQQAKLNAEQAGIQLKYDFNQMFPELDVFGTFGYNGSGTVFSGALYQVQQQDLPTWTIGGQISTPLTVVGPRNNYKAQKISLQQYILLVKQSERDILISIDNDIGTLLADYNSVQATHAQRLYSEQALDAEQKKLDNGKSTLYLVLQHQRDLTSARGAEINALRAYNDHLSQFSLHEGTTLERLNIDFEVK